MTDTRTRRRGRTGRRGFSLAELMIAIGIMGIGLTMAASLFPAAIREHSRSASNVLGMIMTENALETARAALSHPLKDKDNVNVGTSMADCTATVKPEGSLRYPVDAGDASVVSKYGCLIMGRRKTANKNDYPTDQLKIIGSPVIAPNGSFSKIVGIDDTGNAVMAHRLDKNDVTNPWIVVEKSGASLAGTRSPAMGVTSTRTALKLTP